MSDARQQSAKPGGSASGVVIASLLLVMPLLYVLSIGPVAWAVDKLKLDKGPVKAFYLPVLWLHANTPLEKPLEWYLDLFGVH